MIRQIAFIFCSILVSCLMAVPVFVGAGPSMVKGSGSNWTVDFQVSENTDVEVSIVSVKDSSVVRHLAAGMLGAAPPAPLAANALHQTLTWDGKDDFGVSIAQPESLSVRVRAGMAARLDCIAGEDLYSFQGSARSTPSLMFDKNDGTIIMLGQNHGKPFLRKYDAAGRYYQTIYPPAAGLPSDSVTAYGVNVIPGGGWAPKTVAINGPDGGLAGPIITSSMLNSGNTRIVALTANGGIALVNAMDMAIISKDGAWSSSAGQKIITAPPKPTTAYPYGGPFGPQYFTASANPQYLYLSGWFYGMTSSSGSGWLDWADTSGFWADGQVFKVDRTTGVATSWLKLDSVPSLVADRTAKIGWGTNAIATLHGVCIDDSLHVFVCDRLHKRIGVYDTNANLLGSVPCVDPDFVSVSKRTGVLYVLTRGSGLFRMVKFTGWRNVTTPAAQLTLTTSVDGYTGAPVMALTENGSTTNIWVGYGAIGFRLYADNGASFGLLKDFSANATMPLLYERIAVNRANDKLYLEGWNYRTYAISNWANPVVQQVYTTVLDNITVGPKGTVFGYAEAPTTWDLPITRYSGSAALTPANYANTGGNVTSSSIHFEGGYPGNHRGIAVGWQGNVAAFEEAYHLWKFSDTGSSTGTSIITVNSSNLGTRSICNGVKFDPAGNFYIGVMTRGPGAITPPGFAADNAFSTRTGSVVKFAAGTTGTVEITNPISVTGAAKIYPQPFGPFAGDNSSSCNCRNSYFDVDPYGRLFIPHGSTSQIYIADNAGNPILSIGQYGNTDSRGILPGPGQVSTSPAIPIGWPSSVATSEDYICVADAVNARIVRVRMTYALDNIPGLTGKNSSAEIAGRARALAAIASPNPFNPTSYLRVSMAAAGEVRLSVYRADGRLVRNITQGAFTAGEHCFRWDGSDAQARKVTPGLYVYRLTVGNRMLTVKTIMAK
jgi:hypothetical protein